MAQNGRPWSTRARIGDLQLSARPGLPGQALTALSQGGRLTGTPHLVHRLMSYDFSNNSYLGLTGPADYTAHTPFAIPLASRRLHLHCVGQSGAGKTTALKHLIIQDLQLGRGVTVLDPHGDLARSLPDHTPRSRAHELVYLDPSDLARPIGFNPLSGIAADDQPTAADNMVSSFVHVWGAVAVGDRSQEVLRNCLRALMATGTGSLVAIPRMLQDGSYRARVLARQGDPMVRAYWQRHEGLQESFRQQVVAPLSNKLDALLTPGFRAMTGQVRSTISLRRIMDEGRVLICDLSKGRIGEATSHILGAMLTTAIAQAALSRADIPEEQRRPHFLYVDEFQAFATDSFAMIQSDARKYGLILTLSHQFIHQLPDVLKHSVLGTTGSVIAFRVGSEDAKLLAEHLWLDPVFTGALQLEDGARRLTTLPNHQAYARILIDGAPSGPHALTLPPAPAPLHGRGRRFIENSRQRFGRDRHKVEAKLGRFLAGDDRRSVNGAGSRPAKRRLPPRRTRPAS